MNNIVYNTVFFPIGAMHNIENTSYFTDSRYLKFRILKVMKNIMYLISYVELVHGHY